MEQYHDESERQRHWISLMNSIFRMLIGLASCAADAYMCKHMFDATSDPAALIRRMAGEVEGSLGYVDIEEAAKAAKARYDQQTILEAIEILGVYADVLSPRNARLQRASKALSDVLDD